MAKLELSDISKKMKKIDFCMLTTHAENGEIASRPMSNNQEVEYNGDSYFFTYEDTQMVRDIERDPRVALAFTGEKSLIGKPPVFISVEGSAELIKDKSTFAEHWTSDLETYFEKGIDTLGLTMVKVRAASIHYWDGEDDGELKLAA